MLELLEGRLSDAVMRVITDPAEGMFPEAKQIRVGCSCPDWASVCKHVAATFYGVGARLDERPELLFTLCGVDHQELIDEAFDLKAAYAHALIPGNNCLLRQNLPGVAFGLCVGDIVRQDINALAVNAQPRKGCIQRCKGHSNANSLWSVFVTRGSLQLLCQKWPGC